MTRTVTSIRTETVTSTRTDTVISTHTVTLPPLTVTSTVATPPVTVTTTPTPQTAFTDGTYRVGTDIVAGTYRAISPSDSCYWERLRGWSGELGDIIANDFAGQTIVTVAPTDVGFHSSRCGNWTRE